MYHDGGHDLGRPRFDSKYKFNGLLLLIRFSAGSPIDRESSTMHMMS
jgi:hypothetical protein